MSRGQRISSILYGIATIIAAILLLIYRSHAYEVIILVLGIGFTISGIRQLIYYFTMARYMVDGKGILYRGIILINFGVLTTSISNVPKIYILLYLAAINGFSGLVEILRANETRLYRGQAWRLKLTHGIINLTLAVICILFVRWQNTAVYIYSIGLIYSGLARIGSAFRRTTFMFIR